MTANCCHWDGAGWIAGVTLAVKVSGSFFCVESVENEVVVGGGLMV